MGLIDWILVWIVGLVLGWTLYKLWDRTQSDKATMRYRDTDWLKPVDASGAKDTDLSAQGLYDFSTNYIALLKGVLADPTPAKLQRLNERLAAPQNLQNELWEDMAIRLNQAFGNYQTEYTALLSAIAHNSKNPVQLYAAYRLATLIQDPPRDLNRLADIIQDKQEFMKPR